MKHKNRKRNRIIPTLFPDRLNNQFKVAGPNIIWVVDFTLLDTVILDQKILQVKAFFILDLGTSEIIDAKLFFHQRGRHWYNQMVQYKPVRSKLITEIIEKNVSRRGIHNVLIIHSDRGPEFQSIEWGNLFKNHSFLKGSMSPPLSPTSNSIIERFNRTFKADTPILKSIQKHYISKKCLKTDFQKRVFDYNHRQKCQRAEGFTPFLFGQMMKFSNQPLPRPTYTVNTPHEENCAAKAIDEYRKNVINTFKHQFKEESLYQISDQLANLKKNQKLKLALSKITKHKLQQPFQIAISISYLNLLILVNHRYPWRCISRARFLVTCVILTFTGMRISECGKLTKKDIYSLIKYQNVEVYRSKTKDYYRYLCTKESLKYFQLIGPEIEIIFLKSNKLNGGYTHEYYSKFINHQFNLATKEIGIRLYTQSFRISWMILWLQSHISIQRIQKLIHY